MVKKISNFKKKVGRPKGEKRFTTTITLPTIIENDQILNAAVNNIGGRSKLLEKASVKLKCFVVKHGLIVGCEKMKDLLEVR